MTYYSKKEYKLLGYRKSKVAGKMYDAIIENRKTKKIITIPFGSTDYENFRDLTGLNLYPHLIHGDRERRRLYKARHKHHLRPGYYSPSWFSMTQLW